jgi:hypothetical protein
MPTWRLRWVQCAPPALLFAAWVPTEFVAAGCAGGLLGKQRWTQRCQRKRQKMFFEHERPLLYFDKSCF